MKPRKPSKMKPKAKRPSVKAYQKGGMVPSDGKAMPMGKAKPCK